MAATDEWDKMAEARTPEGWTPVTGGYSDRMLDGGQWPELVFEAFGRGSSFGGLRVLVRASKTRPVELDGINYGQAPLRVLVYTGTVSDAAHKLFGPDDTNGSAKNFLLTQLCHHLHEGCSIPTVEVSDGKKTLLTSRGVNVRSGYGKPRPV